MASKRTLITVPFIERDMKGQYLNCDDCPVARATKRFFNWKHLISVSGTYIRVWKGDHVWQSGSSSDWYDIERVVIGKKTIRYKDGFVPSDIEKIKAAFKRNPNTKAHVTLRINP